MRDSQRWKKVVIGETKVYRRREVHTDMDPDIGAPGRNGPVTQPAETADAAAAAGAADTVEAAGERQEPRGRPRVRRPRETWSR